MVGTFRRIKHRLWWLLVPPVVFAGTSYWAANRVSFHTSAIDSAQSVEKSVLLVLSRVKEAETGQRGFLLTGDEKYLAPYRESMASMARDLTELEKAAPPDVVPPNLLQNLRFNVDVKSKEMAGTIDLWKKGDSTEALKLVESGAGLAAMDAIQTEVQRIIDTLEANKAFHARRTETYRNVVTVSGLSSVVLTALGLTMLFALVLRYGKLRDVQAEELKRLNQTLEDRVEERTRELSMANRDLQDFARIASHDLQAPLRTSSALLDLLRARASGQLDREGIELLDRVHRSLKRFHLLLTDLSAYQHVNQDAGSSIEIVPLQDAIRTAIVNLQQPIHDSGAHVLVGDLPGVRGSGSLLTVLFQNLLENAVKYRRPGQVPRIEISAAEEDENVVIAVRDNGIGFDPEYREEIFRPFSRLHSSEYEGTGIGLATCARIAERHEGAIWAASEPGQGSVFYVRLPRAPVDERIGVSRFG